MKREFLLLFLVSLASASLLWQFSADAPVSAKPVANAGMLIVASDDGNIYALDPASGQQRWKTFVGKEPNEVFIFDNSLVASINEGKVVKLDKDGKITWTLNLNVTQYNVSYVYGASANQKNIFITANNGVYSIEKNGSVRSKLVSFNNSIVAPPTAGTDFVIYGKGSDLYKVKENGQIEWTSSLEAGSFWSSRPVIDGGIVYVGALDGMMHAYAVMGGNEVWQARTRGWVLSTPLVRSGVVYFGSNDGSVYAVDAGSGEMMWQAQTSLAVETGPELGIMGGREVVFLGGSDTSAYAIDTTNGEIVWKGSTGGSVGNPLFYQNSVIFGSQDQRVYAYSTERACSITNPMEGDLIGQKEVEVRGKYVSEAGGATVMVDINGAGWEDAIANDTDWEYYIDPKQKFVSGINTISCKVSDSSGEESGESFTTVAITHDPTTPLSKLFITLSPDRIEGKPFTVYVNDGDDGSPVERFTLSVDGQTYNGSNFINITMPNAGNYLIAVKKIGFEDATNSITVNASGINPLYLAGAAILIIIIVWQVWARFLKQRFSKK